MSLLLLFDGSPAPPAAGVELCPLEQQRGIHQGRVLSDTAADADYVFDLGSGSFPEYDLGVGDLVTVAQDVTIEPTSTYVTVAYRVAPPPELPTGLTWQISARFNGTVHWTRVLYAGGIPYTGTVPLSVLGSNRPATDALEFRLEVVNG